jgi:hypothetical protein
MSRYGSHAAEAQQCCAVFVFLAMGVCVFLNMCSVLLAWCPCASLKGRVMLNCFAVQLCTWVIAHCTGWLWIVMSRDCCTSLAHSS